MCAKVAQKHETKEERVKNPSKASERRSSGNGWWLSVRSSCVPLVASARGDDFDKQITAE